MHVIKYFQTLFLLVLLSCNSNNNHFSLRGKTNNIKNGTKLYIRDLTNGVNLDSAIVTNNRFEFKTELPEPALFTMLFSEDKKEFTELWLEDTAMIFDASQSSFKKAVITGSKNQVLFDSLKTKVYSDEISGNDSFVKKREKNFVLNHHNSLVSLYVLYGNHLWSPQETKAMFSKLSVTVQSSSLGQKIQNEIISKDIPEIGEKYIDFTGINKEGDLVKVSSLREKLTLILFWTSSCDFSKKMNQELKEVYENYHSNGFEIIGVSSDKSKEIWLNAINNDKLNWPQLGDNLKGSKKEGFKTYGIQTTPSNIMIDGKGIIIGRNCNLQQIEEFVSSM
ncbi:TlpA disulfide reductase family protein [Galbibacter mesophilus]|uniref:TlpA disulfide reductase family protein n=1 Tax=Galbibacter mesophilus TaxID=379069 RepID=UPI00191F4F9D|nr:TlpA disulfide reductase family protein [Galbibacter mesophilus]MCM5663753.1 AhpC/TSA family protein [Galbibacter mesophilus]